MDFDQLDDFRRRVAACIQNGDLTRADSLLSTRGNLLDRAAELKRGEAALHAYADDLTRRQEAHDKSVAMRAHALADFGEDCLSYSVIYILKHENDSAAYYLELRANADTLNADWQNTVGRYSSDFTADYNKALHYYERALKIQLSVFGENQLEIAQCYNNVGYVYSLLEDNDKALDYLNKSLQIKLLQPNGNTDIANTYNNIGAVYDTRQEYHKALDYYKKALNIQLGISGERHTLVATVYNNIGAVYDSQRKYSQAIDHYKKALNLRLDILGESHPDVAYAYNNIGYAHSAQGYYTEAINYYEKALNILIANYGEKHPNVAVCYSNIGSACQSLGDADKALENYEKYLDIQLHLLGEKHPDIATIYNNLGSINYYIGNYSKAIEYFKHAKSILTEVAGERRGNVAGCYVNLGIAYHSQGDDADALHCFEKALQIQLDIFGDKHTEVATTYIIIGTIYRSQGKYATALEYLEKARPGIETLGKDNPVKQAYYEKVASVYWLAEAEGERLPGYDIFMSEGVFMMTTGPDDIPGMAGEYTILQYGDWDIDSRESFLQKYEELRGRPKTITVMQDSTITQYNLAPSIEIELTFMRIGKEERQNITDAYHNWKR